jgi:hypothetical protein
MELSIWRFGSRFESNIKAWSGTLMFHMRGCGRLRGDDLEWECQVEPNNYYAQVKQHDELRGILVSNHLSDGGTNGRNRRKEVEKVGHPMTDDCSRQVG